MSAINAKASRKMKKYAVLTREPRCFLGSLAFSWEQRKLSEMCGTFEYGLNAAAKEFDGKNKYIRITDIDDASREFLLSDLSSPDICLDGMSKYLLSSGDIVFARTGASVGKTYIYRENDGIVYFAGFLIRAKVNQDNDAEFVFQSTLSPSYEKYIRITSQRSGQPGVNAQEYGEYDLFAPSKEEQQRIGHFLRGIDNLITLHQRKFEKLTNVKKSMLEKMFPQNGCSYPEIRFKGFTDAWEQRKLTEFVEFFSGLTYTPNDVQENGTLVLRSSNVSNGEVVDADNIYVNPQVVNSENVKVGDIVVVVRNGSRSLIGKHAQIKAFMPNTVIGAFMTGIRSECPEFTNALLNTSRFEEEIAMNMGATINQITGYMFSKMEFKVPCLDEQKKIGEYFEKLDNLITLHQRQPFLHSSPDISLIVQLTPPFYTFSWEPRKLGELVDRVVRKNTNNESTLPLTISAQYGLVDQITYFNNRVASRDVSNYYLVLNGEFAYNKSTSDGYPFGAVKRLDLYEKGVLSTLYIVFSPKKEQQVDSDFLTVFFDTDRWHKGVAERAAEGARNHGLLNISAEDFFDIDLSVPKDVAEQKQIGAIIRQLDNLITLHQRKHLRLHP